MEIKEQYQVKILNRLAALENFYDDLFNNRTRKSIRENKKPSATESPGYYELNSGTTVPRRRLHMKF
jgi:hypothetical protein